MKKISLLGAALLLAAAAFSQPISLIPQPAELTARSGKFRLSANTKLGCNSPEARPVAEMLAERLAAPTGFKLKVQKQGGNIQLNLLATPDPALGNEGYALEVSSTSVKISANRPAGLFYGVQTLLQLFPKEIENQSVANATWTAPAVSIRDWPRFGWRGLMLDVSRHFMPKDDVKRYIDRMAQFKFNTFHWHLTDDQGWRVEIKSLERLTSVGACRVQRYGKYGNMEPRRPGEAATDCGFYTQDDVREIVAYAAARHITIVPEIDVPGHSAAAVAAYPMLCATQDTTVPVCFGQDFSDWHEDGTFEMKIDNTLNPSNEAVYVFMEKVLSEVAALFPGQYIHVGGDECYRGFWEKDPGCQQLMARENMKNSVELHGYFMRRVEEIIRSKGKKMIGWDEILEGGVAPEATVMSWRGTKGGIEAARLGHQVVMTPAAWTYLDMAQGEVSAEPQGQTWAPAPLVNCYNFEPVPDSVDARFILGGQGCLWSEMVPSRRHAEYMTWPRGWALAETYWSPKAVRSWEKFLPRMETQMERAEIAGVNFARSTYDALIKPRLEGEKLVVSISTEFPGLDVFYTLDESMPDHFSPRAAAGQAIEVPPGDVTVKAISYRNGKPIGKIIALPRTELLRRAQKG